MGRRKIDIEFIKEDRSRATTFIKRKSGLFKKAHELAILTGAKVAVIVFSQQDKLYTYSNEPCEEICSRYVKYVQNAGANEERGPQDYSANQDNDDDSEDDVVYVPTSARKGSVSGHGRTDSNASTKLTASSPKGHSRKNSDSRSTPIPSSPKPDMPAKAQDNGHRSPSVLSHKRASSESGFVRHESPKFPKHEHVPRELSDVRSSPHQPSRPRTASLNKTTPPMMQNPQFPQPHAVQDNGPTQQQYLQPLLEARPMFMQQQQGQLLQQNPAQQNANMEQSRQIQYPDSESLGNNTGQRRPEYAVPAYASSTTSTRQLPMAPPLTIPSNPYSGQAPQPQPAQPLLPPGTGHAGTSRVLLPGEGNLATTGLTPTESPSNFASSLYSNSGISGIGTNISMPRISTDVGSLFYNWQTNEPGLSPATSMMLNQFRDGEMNNATAGNNSRGPSSGQMSGGISAGVLENFSPITAQWLSGHPIPIAQPPAETKPS